MNIYKKKSSLVGERFAALQPSAPTASSYVLPRVGVGMRWQF
jgi:hypothetical protein